jgi:hypothetical protein
MVSGFAVTSSQVGVAQTPAASPGVYSPKAAVQSPPLRVEVIDGTRFRDIETHEAYRLYGIDTCAPAGGSPLPRLDLAVRLQAGRAR